MTKPAINMQYRLLRNNKESGPYTKAQLEEIGLKPYDLLWIEGRGGAWLYASEIEDLKSIAPVVEEQPYDRFFKGKEKQASTTNSKQNSSSITNASAASNSATLKPPKPRFRISGDKVIMVDNAAQQQPQQATTVVTTVSKTQQPAAIAEKQVVKQEIGAHIQSVGGLEWEDMYSEWKGEDKQSQKQESAAPAKAQTMDEVRQRYEEAKRKQLGEKQNKGTSSTKQNIMAAVAIAVLVIGGYAGYKLNNGSNNSHRSTQTAPVEKAEIVQDGNNQQQNSTDESQNTTDGSAANTTSVAQQAPDKTVSSPSEIKNSLSANNSNTNTQALPLTENKGTASSKKEQQIAPATNSTTNNVGKPNQQATQQVSLTEKSKVNNNSIPPVKDKKGDNVQADSKKVSTTAPVQTPTDEQPATVKPAPPAKKISDYITLSKLGSGNSNSVQNVLLSVKNVTDFPIDLAVIDIQYYGTNGHYQKGETLYVKNIEAGSNVNVRIPDSKTSRSITYKVSLVSSEQKTLYLVGE